MSLSRRRSGLIAATFVALMLGACTRDPAVAKQHHLEKARAYYAKNQFNEAILELRNSLQIDPKFAPAAHLLGRAYMAKSWHLDATRELRRAVELQPDDLAVRTDLGYAYVRIEAWPDVLDAAEAIARKNPNNADAMYFRAAGLNAKGEQREALSAVDKALRVAPRAEFHTIRGDILGELKQYVEAEEAYKQALAQNPKSATARIGLSNVLRKQNRSDEARRLLDEAKADEPANAAVRVALSMLNADAGNLEEARKELESLPRETWTPRVAYVAGQLEVRTQRFTEAFATLTALKQIMPDYYGARYWLGHALIGLKRPDEALMEFRAAEQKAPDNVFIRLGLAEAYLEARRPREALSVLNGIGKPLEKASDYHLLLGRTHLALGATDEAIRSARAALTIAPENARAYILLGTAYATKGELRAAHEALGKGIEVAPSYTPSRIARGNVYNLEKKPEDALKEYESALAADPHSQSALSAKVSTLVQQNRLDEAIGFVQSASKADPKNAGPHELLARLYMLKKDARTAEKEVREALQLDDSSILVRLTAARIAINNGKPNDAVPHLQRVLKDQPNHLAAALMLADLHARQFRYDQAVLTLESVAQSSADRTPTLAIANFLIRAGRYDEAIARLTPLLKQTPDLVQARLLMGLVQLNKGNFAGAADQFTAVNRLNPQLAYGHYYLGRTLAARGEPEAAKREYERASALAPENKQIKIELATISTGKPDPALVSAWIEELKASLEKDPANTMRREELGQAYLSIKQLPQAEAEFRRVLEVSPLSPSANQAMALIRIAQKKPDEVLGYLQNVLKVEPSNVRANLLIAQYYEAKGNRELALQYVESLYRTNPDMAGVRLHLARLYGTTGRALQGIARAKEAVASEPRSASAHGLLGTLYLQNGEVTQAISALKMALELDPNSAAAQFTLGEAYDREGDTANALTAYKRTMTLAPNRPEPYNNAAWIYASQGRNLDEALTFAKKARDLAPNNASVLDTLGWVHYQRGDYQSAEPILKKAAELHEKSPAVFYHLGMTYTKLGRRTDAVAALRRSLLLGDSPPFATEVRAKLAELEK